MWQTHIMESMKTAISRCDPSQILYIEAMKTISAWCPVIKTFYFGDVRDLLGTKKMDSTVPLFQQYPEYNKFPYKDCLFEADGFGYGMEEGQYPAKKRATLVNADEDFAVLMLLHCIDSEYEMMESVKGMWVLEPFMVILRIGTGEVINEGSFLAAAVANQHYKSLFKLELGEVLTVPLIPGIPPEGHSLYLRDGNADATFLKHALLMLHCKNIMSEVVQPSEKLNKKRLKNNKLPFFSYHILKVVLPGSVGGKKTISLGTGTRHRLNFCMGHFKHYTREKPLFGKHSGLFWWNEFARGDKELGIVEKDYNIEVKK